MIIYVIKGPQMGMTQRELEIEAKAKALGQEAHREGLTDVALNCPAYVSAFVGELEGLSELLLGLDSFKWGWHSEESKHEIRPF